MVSKEDRGYKAMGRAMARSRLKDLPQKINQLHRKIKLRQWSMLKYAYQCGRLLNEAKTISGKHGTWKKWIHDNFDGRYETSVVYRRVAKEWNSEAAKEARKKGKHFNSIKHFLDFVKDMRINPKKKILTEKQQKEIDYKRDMIRDMVLEKTNELDDFEFKILFKHFEHFWSKLDDELKAILHMVYEYYSYEDEKESEQLKKEARQKVQQAHRRKMKSQLTTN